MEEWKTYKLEDLTIDGKGHYGIGAPAVEYDENKYTYLRITDINDDGSLNYSGLKSVDDPEAGKYLLKEGDIVFARTGNSTGRSYFYEPSDGQFVFAGFLIKFSIDPSKVNPRFLKYYTHSKPYYEWVQSFDTGATRGNINAQTFGSMEINLPPRDIQDRLVEILSSLDEKIKLNNRINHNLEEQAQALYKSWFVDFEPFRKGRFIESELGLIPEGWQVKNLLEISRIFDSKRRPLSGKEREQMSKIYPYYGATSIMDYVDSYIFDGIYLLMGEDGSVMTEEGYPFLQYITGKFWPNNHAHVLQGDNGFSTEMLHCALLRKVIKSSVTGAVQAKISQANMKKILFPCPPSLELKAFDSQLQTIYCQKRNIEAQNSDLAMLRDSLLPVLIVGKLNC